MNWKNMTLEAGFIKQEINLKGLQTVNYIPVDQIDSFGVVSSENKRWLYMGIFVAAFALVTAINKNTQATVIAGLISACLICFYFISRRTWLTITSNQTKFSVQVTTSSEELKSVNDFVLQIKQSIHSTQDKNLTKVA